MPLPAQVWIVEVGLRDGLQLAGQVVPVEAKLRLLRALHATGLRAMEVTSFVSPAAVPQFADAETVARAAVALPDLRVSALIPNLRGQVRAHAVGIRHVTFVVAATDAFNVENVRMPVEESLAHLAPIVQAQRAVPEASVEVGIAVAFGCPYTGPVPFEAIRKIVDRAVALGVGGIALGDTIGVATPEQVYLAASRLRDAYPNLPLGLHLHDTRGLGLANVLAGMEAGVTTFDASVGGMGGCPAAPGATGNIATETLNQALQERGFVTHIDQGALLDCARLVHELITPDLPSRAPSGQPSPASLPGPRPGPAA